MQSSDLITDVLPDHEVSLLAGASGAGKTTLIMQVLAALQHNQSPFGLEAQANLKIGYIAADRSWRSYQKTASLVNLDLSRIQSRALIDDPTIDLANFEANPIKELERLIHLLLPCDLIVVDPLVVFLGVDTNKYHLNAARLIRLNKLCQANNFTILGTHHATKARSDYGFKRPQDRISGTSALLGFTSTQLFLASPDETGREDGFSEWHIVSHHAPARCLLLGRDSSGAFRLMGEERRGEAYGAQPGAQPPEQLIINLFTPTSRLARKEILARAADFDMAPRTIDRLLSELISSQILSRDEFGHYIISPLVPQIRPEA